MSGGGSGTGRRGGPAGDDEEPIPEPPAPGPATAIQESSEEENVYPIGQITGNHRLLGLVDGEIVGLGGATRLSFTGQTLILGPCLDGQVTVRNGNFFEGIDAPWALQEFQAQAELAIDEQYLGIDFLDGNAHKLYRLVADLACAADTISVEFQFDGGAWVAVGHIYAFNNEDSVAPGSNAGTALAGTTATSRIVFDGKVFARVFAGTVRLSPFHAVVSDPTATIEGSSLMGHLRSANTTGNLTGIRFAGIGPTAIKAGSYIRIDALDLTP